MSAAPGEFAEMHGVRLKRRDDAVLDDARKTGGVFEPLSMKFWRDACFRARGELQAVIDVGAYTGLYAIRAARDGVGVVIALEPSRPAFNRLVSNATANHVRIGIEGPLVVYEAAAGPVQGKAHVRPHNAGALTSAKCYVEAAGSGDEPTFAEVEMCRLDDLVAIPPRGVKAIKIDVEGGELGVLQGAEGIVEHSRPWILLEVLTEDAEIAARQWAQAHDYRVAMQLDQRNLALMP